MKEKNIRKVIDNAAKLQEERKITPIICDMIAESNLSEFIKGYLISIVIDEVDGGFCTKNLKEKMENQCFWLSMYLGKTNEWY